MRAVLLLFAEVEVDLMATFLEVQDLTVACFEVIIDKDSFQLL